MAMQATRERKERFIISFGKPAQSTGNAAVSFILREFGLAEFSDWAIDAMVDECIASARASIKHNNQNRRIYRSELGVPARQSLTQSIRWGAQ